MPNTVIFNYDIDQVQADSFFIQQSWDKNRTKRIYKNTHTLTDIYYEPGYPITKLIANDSVIRTIDVHTPTDRWFFYAIDNVANYIPEYIKTEKYLSNGTLRLSREQVLFCQGNFLSMKATTKGCANEASLLPDREIKGNETDLTALTFDVSKWTDLEISSNNNMVSIYIDNKKLFSAPNFRTAKYISGMAFISNGLPEVDHLELSGPDGTTAYKNEFGDQ